MDSKTKGTWLVHHMNKLRQVTNVSDFENVHTAGKLGVLLSGLSASDASSLTNAQVAAIARAANISTLEQPVLLQQLATKRLINVGQHGIEVLGVTSGAVLDHTASAFDELGPTPHERAAIDIAEMVSREPIDTNLAAQYIGDTFKLASADAAELLVQSEQIGFLDAEELDPGRKLLFNGNLFRRDNAKKIQSVMGSLSVDDHRRVQSMEQYLKLHGCATVLEAQQILGDGLFSKLQSIAMYDVSEVSNEKEQVLYVTRPGAFGKFGGDAFAEDAMDLAKAFVACLKYGMTKRQASHGRIQMLKRLVGSLINGNWVGPATAIGQDYKVLEMKRVVEIKPDRGYFSMRLLKKEVGELALQVLTEGDASEQSLQNFPGASVSRYRPPEENRVVTRKKQNALSKKGTKDILFALRTGK